MAQNSSVTKISPLISVGGAWCNGDVSQHATGFMHSDYAGNPYSDLGFRLMAKRSRDDNNRFYPVITRL